MAYMAKILEFLANGTANIASGSMVQAMKINRIRPISRDAKPHNLADNRGGVEGGSSDEIS